MLHVDVADLDAYLAIHIWKGVASLVNQPNLCWSWKTHPIYSHSYYRTSI